MYWIVKPVMILVLVILFIAWFLADLALAAAERALELAEELRQWAVDVPPDDWKEIQTTQTLGEPDDESKF